MNIKERFGLKVKGFRIKNGLSQEGLALKADIDRTYMSGIEKGKRNVSILVIEKLAIALDVEIKELFD